MNRITSIMRHLGGSMRALRIDRRGSVAWLLAGALVPLVAAVGLSVDGARGWLVKSRLSQAIDAAGLAGGRVISSATRDDDIRHFFEANFPPGFMKAQLDGPHISVNAEKTTITINAKAKIPTTFMRVVGIKDLTVRADTVVKRTDRGMELVLVMDNTGSMQQNDRIGKMKIAATDLVNLLYGSRDTVPNLWVGVVPYVATVNIGPTNGAWTVQRTAPSYTVTLARTTNLDASNQPTIDTSTVCATVASGGNHSFHDGQIIDVSGASGTGSGVYNGRFLIRTINTPGCNITDPKKKFWYVIQNEAAANPSGTIIASVPATDYISRGGQWSGCVEARPSPYEEDQAQALPDAPETKWVQYYWPSTRGVRFYNKHKRAYPLSNGRYGDNDWGSPGYNGASGMNPAVKDNVGWDYLAYGPNFGCGTPITPLQQNKETVTNAISAMAPWGRSGTMANLGLAWAWRVLSPAWRGKWSGSPANMPLDYDTPLIDKVVVLLTDGNNEWYDWSSLPPGCAGMSNCSDTDAGLPTDADHTAYGRLAERRLGAGIVTNGDAQIELNIRMANLCEAMKAKGIIIYTIVVEVPNQATNTLYSGCATKSEYYFPTPDADDLGTVFKKIADQLANLRLAQ
jgi:Flp pilus assembly protein TadG